jgi:succinate-semialdehyde dehydrogenase/glutarate-semialdehyde dehydrogenase
MYAVVNPTTGETVKEYPTVSDDGLMDAVARASNAGRDWAGGVAARAAALRSVAEGHRERREELAKIVVTEIGKPLPQALMEVDVVSVIYGYYAEKAEELVADEPVPVSYGSGSAVVRRRPLGVILGVMPWNFPYYQVARFAAPNLAVGNTVLLKPAPQCPRSAEMMQEIFASAGLGDHYVTILATHDQIARVIADPRVQGVSVTGSERAGSAIAEIAGRHLKKVVLELGGSDPFIVLGTNDLDGTVAYAVKARLANAGQACAAAKRFVVIDGLYEEFVNKYTEQSAGWKVGDPEDEGTAVGPLSSLAAAERLEDQVRLAVEHGATLFAGGKRSGAFFESTILTDITPDNPASRQEFFGPVAQMYRAKDEDDAVRIANDIPFGLGSYLITPDREQAERVSDRIEAGMVFVNNAGGGGGIDLPFGGIKRSGFGREQGRFGADEFVNKKLIYMGGD